MTNGSARRSKPEIRPDVAGMRKIYDIALCATILVIVILAPLYLLFAVYAQRQF